MQRFNIISSFKVAGSVLSAESVGEHIYLFDSSYFISKIPLYGAGDGFRAQIVKNAQKLMYEYSKSISFRSGQECIVSLEKSQKANILSLTSNKIAKKHSLDIFGSAIVVSVFSQNGNFVAIGAEDGDFAIFKNRQNGLSLIERFEKQGDSVSSISFSRSDNYVCVSYFNKKSIVYDIAKNKIIFSFETDGVVEKTLFFSDDSGLACVCRNGGVEIYDMSVRQHLYRCVLGEFWPSDAIFLNEHAIAVSTREGYLLFFDVDDFFLVDSINFNAPISKLCCDENRLFVCFCDGRVFAIDLKHKINEFLVFVKTDRMHEADSLFEHNIFLVFESEFKTKAKEGWSENLKELSFMLSKGENDAAYKLAKPFLRLPSIAAHYQELLSQTAELAAFFDAIENDDYASAYKIAHSIPAIQKLPAFAALEQIFAETMKAVIKLLEEGGLSGKQTAIAKLKPFLLVPTKRNIIEDIIKNWANYEKAVAIFKNKQFKEFFAICEKSVFLKECAIYKKAFNLGREIMIRLQTNEDKKEYEEALKLARLLCDFSPFKEEALKKVKTLELQMETLLKLNHYRDGKLLLADLFEFIEENPTLDDFSAFTEFVTGIKDEILDIYKNGAGSEEAYAKLEEYKNIPYLRKYFELPEVKIAQNSFACYKQDVGLSK